MKQMTSHSNLIPHLIWRGESIRASSQSICMEQKAWKVIEKRTDRRTDGRTDEGKYIGLSG